MLGYLLAQSPFERQLVETYWLGDTANEAPFVMELQGKGRLVYVDAAGTLRRGTWKPRGTGIEIEINHGSLRLTGMVQGNRINGVASGADGHTWQWPATRQPVVAEASVPKYPL